MREDERAADLIVRLINENPGYINLCLVGPLTNMALALTLDPSIADKVGLVVVMGGTRQALGN